MRIKGIDVEDADRGDRRLLDASNEAREFLRAQDAYTLHKPIRRKFPRRKTVSLGIDRIWQLDLADLTNISRYNDNYKFILTGIDFFSRYAFAVAPGIA